MMSQESGDSVAPLGIDDDPEQDDAFSPERTYQRRLRFARYVRWMMIACVILLAAGGARQIVVARAAAAEEAPRASLAFTLAPPSTPTTNAAAASGEAATPGLPGASAPAAASAPVVADAKPVDPKEAKREKKIAQHALDKGKVAAAIAAGSRSVALDPTDAEAWLVLGAAYLESRDVVSARHAFTSCSASATHGPKGECAAMLR